MRGNGSEDLPAVGSRAALARVAALVAVLALAIGLAAGCGDDDEDAGGGGGGASTTPAAAEKTDVQAALEKVKKGFEGTGTAPTQGTEAQKGKTVIVVECGFVAVGCNAPSQAFEEAAKDLGWKVEQIDGKLSPAGYTAGIRQAISAKPDGIVTIGISCGEAKGAYRAAKAADIPVVGLYEFDCDDPKINSGPALMDAVWPYVEGDSGPVPGDWFKEWASYAAAYIIAKTEGKAKVIEFQQRPFINTIYADEGFEAAMKECSGCEIVAQQEITAQDLGPTQGGAQKVAAMVRKHPDANAIYFDNDTIAAQAATSLKTLPQTKDWIIIGAEGYPNTLDLVRDGTLTALNGIPVEWFGWCAAWMMNELFADQPVTNCGAGSQLIDKDNNLPGPGKPWVPKVDFKSAMQGIWAGQ